MRDFFISLFIAFITALILIAVVALIDNFKEESWRIGIGKKPIWVQCDETQKKFPQFDKDYVVKEFKSGKLDGLLELGWTDYGLGSSIDRMDYFILYYPLDEYTHLEVRWSGTFFSEDCKSGQWPPQIKITNRSIWFLGGVYIKGTKEPYEWLKKNPDYWKIKQVVGNRGIQ